MCVWCLFYERKYPSLSHQTSELLFDLTYLAFFFPPLLFYLFFLFFKQMVLRNTHAHTHTGNNILFIHTRSQ